MEKRNIQTTGGSSFTITLPKKWITHQDLHKNDCLDILQTQFGALLVRPQNGKRKKISTLQIDYLPFVHIVREITSSYIAGVEEIHIQAHTITYEQRSLVRNISYKLLGFEQFNSISNLIVLKNVSSSTILPTEYIEKMFSISISMYQDLVKVLQNNSPQLARDIIDRDVEVDRIHLMIIRMFNMLLYTIIPDNSELSLFDVHYYEHIGIRLERIADHIVQSANTLLSDTTVSFTRLEWHAIEQLNSYLETCKEIVTHQDKRMANKLLDTLEQKELTPFVNKKIKDTSQQQIIIANSLDRIAGYIMNITEETLNYLTIKHIYY